MGHKYPTVGEVLMGTLSPLGSCLINFNSLVIALNLDQSGKTSAALVSTVDLEWQARKCSTHWIAKNQGGLQ